MNDTIQGTTDAPQGRPGQPGHDAGLPADEHEVTASPTPTAAATDPVEAARQERRIDADAGLSPAAALGAAAGAGLGGGGGTTGGGPTAAPAVGAASDDKTIAIVNYVLMIVGVLATAGVLNLVALVLAYAKRSEASDWVRSHYDFQIRTFWISLIAGLVGIATMIIGIGFAILLLLAIWVLVRAVVGLSHVTSNRPYPNVQTWLV